MKKLVKQIISFGIVGGLSFCLDSFTMILLTEGFNLHYLISSTFSFLLSVSFNYICSTKFVFHANKKIGKQKEFLIFVILSIFGLFINQLVMWFMVERLAVFYIKTKVFATGVVMIWNFGSRKLWIEGHK